MSAAKSIGSTRQEAAWGRQMFAASLVSKARSAPVNDRLFPMPVAVLNRSPA
jgi:hypothetical protein